MKRIFIFLTMLSMCSFEAIGQSSEDSVKATINQLFDAMKNVDVALLQDAFADSAVLQTIARSREGKVSIRNEKVSRFAEEIGKLPKGAADERIQFETIKIDADLAIVWTPYKFFYNGQLSHCGVNSFQLVRLNGKWKIQYLIDTRRRVGCE